MPTSEQKQHGKAGRAAWRVLAMVCGLLAAKQARKLVDVTWRKLLGGDPPTNPASPVTTWPEALAWAAISGVVVQTARMVSQRLAAAGWVQATGALPPGLEEGPGQ